MPRDGASRIQEADRRAASAADFYRDLIALNLNRPYASIDDFRALASALLTARRELLPRQRPDEAVSMPSARSRQTSLLLATLADETLYAATLRFPKECQEDWRVIYERIDENVCSSDGKAPRSAVFRGIEFCQGDILISKEDSLFSSFSARMLKYPMPFSHAAVASVAAGSARSLLTIDSDGRDGGVKLRDPAKSSPMRLFVYRARANTTERRQALLRSAIAGTDLYLAEMRRLTGGDPAGKAAIPFDFRSRPDDPSEQYCTEVPYYLYNKGGLTGSRNPYPRILWSEHDDLGGGRPGAASFLRLAATFESTASRDPGDIEFNPNFDLAAVMIAPKSLARERIDAALADVAFADLREDFKGARTRYEGFISEFSDNNAGPADIDTLRRSKAFSAAYVAGIAESVFSRKANFSLKTVIYFVAIDRILGSPNADSLRSRLIAADAKRFALTGRPMGLNALRAFAAAETAAEIDRILKDWDARRRP